MTPAFPVYEVGSLSYSYFVGTSRAPRSCVIAVRITSGAFARRPRSDRSTSKVGALTASSSSVEPTDAPVGGRHTPTHAARLLNSTNDDDDGVSPRAGRVPRERASPRGRVASIGASRRSLARGRTVHVSTARAAPRGGDARRPRRGRDRRRRPRRWRVRAPRRLSRGDRRPRRLRLRARVRPGRVRVRRRRRRRHDHVATRIRPRRRRRPRSRPRRRRRRRHHRRVVPPSRASLRRRRVRVRRPPRRARRRPRGPPVDVQPPRHSRVLARAAPRLLQAHRRAHLASLGLGRGSPLGCRRGTRDGRRQLASPRRCAQGYRRRARPRVCQGGPGRRHPPRSVTPRVPRGASDAPGPGVSVRIERGARVGSATVGWAATGGRLRGRERV